MAKPFDHYVAQQKRKAEALEAQIRADERERLLAYLEKVRQESLDDHEDLDEYDKGWLDAYANAIELIKWRNP
jgi:hypothetical protein